MKQVDLRPAYGWTCEECGRDNFQSATVLETCMQESPKVGIIDLDGDFISYPKQVKCNFCGEKFETNIEE